MRCADKKETRDVRYECRQCLAGSTARGDCASGVCSNSLHEEWQDTGNGQRENKPC